MDGILVKYNSFGEYQWNKTWGGDGEDYSIGMVHDSNNNIYLVGKIDMDPMNGNSDSILLKYNSLGE